nr:Asp/Glu racemase [uncultured Cohaesibacter sp.]
MVERLAFLHTADSNVEPFDAAALAAGFGASRHQVRSDLLARATEEGGVSAALEADVEAALDEELSKADLVFLTCSSIGAVADKMQEQGLPIQRTDKVLADAVLADALALPKGASVAVLVVAPTSIGPTSNLFKAQQSAMKAEGVPLDVTLVPDVWNDFLAGDMARYLEGLKQAIVRFAAANPSYTHIALAQASMSKAAEGVDVGGASLWTIPSATKAYLAKLKQG